MNNPDFTSIPMDNIIRLVVSAQEVVVVGLYLAAAAHLVRNREGQAAATGRLASMLGISTLLAISIYDEFATWGTHLTPREPLQQTAAILLLVAWWKLIGVQFLTVRGARTRAEEDDLRCAELRRRANRTRESMGVPPTGEHQLPPPIKQRR